MTRSAFLVFATAAGVLMGSMAQAEKIELAIDGPDRVTGGGFALVGHAPEGAIVRWRIDAPEGTVEPLRLRDDSGDPVLVFLNAAHGRYSVALIAQVPSDGLDPVGETQHETIVGPLNPQPDPAPDPTPQPIPEPTPAPDPEPIDPPIAGEGLRVLIIFETDDLDELPESQVAILNSTELREYLLDHAARDNGVPGFRVWHDDYADASVAHESEVWQAAYERAKADAKALPWIIAANDGKGVSQALPETIEATIELLKTIE